MSTNKLTQRERILSYLRARKKATNMELVMALALACPWKRLRDATNPRGEVYELDRDGHWRETGERITRERIKTKGGAWVTQYTLTGTKR